MHKFIILFTVITSLLSSFALSNLYGQNKTLQEKRFINLVKKRDMGEKQLILFKKMQKEGKRISDAQIASKQMKLEQVQAQLAALAKQLNKQVPPSPFAPKPNNATGASGGGVTLADIDPDDPEAILATADKIRLAQIDVPMIDQSRLSASQQTQLKDLHKKLSRLDLSMRLGVSRIVRQSDIKYLKEMHEASQARRKIINQLAELHRLSEKKPPALSPTGKTVRFGTPSVQRLPVVKLKLGGQKLDIYKNGTASKTLTFPLTLPNENIRGYISPYITDVLDSRGKSIRRIIGGGHSDQHLYSQSRMLKIVRDDFKVYIALTQGNKTFHKAMGILPLIEVIDEQIITISNLNEYKLGETAKLRVQDQNDQWLVDKLGMKVNYTHDPKLKLTPYQLNISCLNSYQRCLSVTADVKKGSAGGHARKDGIRLQGKHPFSEKDSFKIQILLDYRILEMPFEIVK